MAQIAMMPEAESARLGDTRAYVDGIIARQLAAAKSDWYKFFVDYDPAPALRAVDVPVFATFGGRDLQVLDSQNRPALESLFSGERASLLTTKVYPAANHLLQPALTGAPAEYATLPKTFVDGFLMDLSTWVVNLPH